MSRNIWPEGVRVFFLMLPTERNCETWKVSHIPLGWAFPGGRCLAPCILYELALSWFATSLSAFVGLGNVWSTSMNKCGDKLQGVYYAFFMYLFSHQPGYPRLCSQFCV